MPDCLWHVYPHVQVGCYQDATGFLFVMDEGRQTCNYRTTKAHLESWQRQSLLKYTDKPPHKDCHKDCCITTLCGPLPCGLPKDECYCQPSGMQSECYWMCICLYAGVLVDTYTSASTLTYAYASTNMLLICIYITQHACICVCTASTLLICICISQHFLYMHMHVLA